LKGSKLEIISMGQITKNNKQLSSLSPCDICDAALKDFSEKHEMEIIYKWEKGEKKYNGCK